METKAEILEKQLDEMKNKETAYIDQKEKFQELEQKYLHCINQSNTSQASCLRNTPPLSQHTDSLCSYQIPSLHHNYSKIDPGNYKAFPTAMCSGYNSWKLLETNDYYDHSENKPLSANLMIYPRQPVNPIMNQNQPINPTGSLNPQLSSIVYPNQLENQVIHSNQLINPMINPNLTGNRITHPLQANNTVTCLSNPPYSVMPLAQAGNTCTSSNIQNSTNSNAQIDLSFSTPNKCTPVQSHHSKVHNSSTFHERITLDVYIFSK